VEVVNLVRIVCFQIVAEALGSEEGPKKSRRYMREKGQIDAPAGVRVFSRFYAIRCRIRALGLPVFVLV
jgi:hypothetical protein